MAYIALIGERNLIYVGLTYTISLLDKPRLLTLEGFELSNLHILFIKEHILLALYWGKLVRLRPERVPL